MSVERNIFELKFKLLKIQIHHNGRYNSVKLNSAHRRFEMHASRLSSRPYQSPKRDTVEISADILCTYLNSITCWLNIQETDFIILLCYYVSGRAQMKSGRNLL